MKLPLRTSRATVAVLVLLCVAPLPATCQQTPAVPNANKDAMSAQLIPRLADGHPDLNGFWASGSGPDTPVGSSFGPPRDPNIKRGDWAGAKEQAADPNQPPYKPELMAKVQELARTESKSDPAFFCKPGGVPRIGPPHAIIQASGMPIVFLTKLSPVIVFAWCRRMVAAMTRKRTTPTTETQSDIGREIHWLSTPLNSTTIPGLDCMDGSTARLCM